MSLRTKLILPFAYLLLGLLMGCTNERLINCDITGEFTFDFIANTDQVDKFPDEVSQIDLYAFDAQGLYVGSFHAEKISDGKTFRLPILLQPGVYSFVVWGGSKDSYVVGEVADTTTINDLIVGKTRFEDARLAIKNEDRVVSDRPDDLFYGILSGVKITNASAHHHISLVKNTNTLNITLKGLDGLLGKALYPDVDLYCLGTNGKLKFDNNVSEQARQIVYIPYTREIDQTDLFVQVTTLNLQTDVQARLVVKHNQIDDLLLNVDLVEQILKLPTVNTDLDLLLNDTYDIVLEFDALLGVSVTINGYVINNSDNEIH